MQKLQNTLLISFILVTLIGVLILISTTNNISLSQEIGHVAEDKFNSIIINLYVPYKSPEFIIKEKQNMVELMNIFDNVFVKMTEKLNINFDYELLERYDIKLSYNDQTHMNNIKISIYDKNYLSINGKMYKIKNDVDLTQIYEITIREKQSTKIGDFYYNLIKDKK